MAKTWNTDFDWYKTKDQSIKMRGSAALASVFIKDNNMALSTTKKRYVWPTALNDGSRFMSRKVFGKEI